MTYRRLTLRPLNALLAQALYSRTLRRAALGAGALAPAFALANPTGGQVAAGTATIKAPDANHMIIDQASQNAIINWQEFSIGSDQFVQFIQPDSSAVALNRVVGGNPSQILGNLSANGQVFLVNPNGVFFGKSATLDVQGLIATTLDIKDSDFLNGNYVFSKASGAPDAGVTNAGSISANGGYVVLAGDYADNQGVIAAQTGQVVLASGKQMTLTLNNNALVSFVVNQATLAQYAGVSNSGSITADGGIVLMTAKVANALTATAVNNSGLITAHSIQDHNGTIILAAQGGDIEESGALDASATQSGVMGGDVVIRGDHHTAIASAANINAAGDNANGGFVDLSGHHLSVRGEINLGHGGSLLIDPAKLFITDGASSGASITSGDYVGTQFIQIQLNANNNVTLIASNSIVAGIPSGLPSTIHAGTAISATGTGNLTVKTGTLTYHGTGSTIKGSLTGFPTSHCGLGVCASYTSTTPPSQPTYTFAQTSGTINLTGLTINIAGGFTANAGNGTVTLSNVTAKSVSVTGGSVTVGNVTTSGTTGGSLKYGINITANQTASYGGPANITAGALTAAAGRIKLHQTHAGSVYTGTGGKINVTGAISAAAGGVSISAASNKGASGGGKITLGGNVTGKSIYISTKGKKGNGISVAGGLKATGTLAGSGVILYASASGGAAASGGTVNVNGAIGSAGISAANGGASLTGKGGGNSGGLVNVKYAINVKGGINIQATNLGTGTAAAAKIAIANATGQHEHLSAHGAKASISAGNLIANGPVGTSQSTTKGAVTEYLYKASGTAAATAGKITVNGSIKSSNSGVTLSGPSISAPNALTVTAKKAVTLTGPATAKSVSITGGAVSVGNVTATGATGITLTAKQSAATGPAANITAGALTATAGGISLTQSYTGGGTGTGGGINVTGAISAGGALGITATDKAAGRSSGGNIALTTVKAKSINISASAKKGADITVQSLQATGTASTSNVTLAASNSSAGHSGGNINVSGSAGIVAAAGGVSLTAKGGLDSGGKVKVTGNIQAGRLVSVTADHTGTCCGSIALANVTGSGIHIQLTEAGSHASGITLGSLTATGSGASNDVSVVLSGGTQPSTITVNGAVKSSHGNVTLNGASLDSIAVTGGVTAGNVATLHGKKVNVTGNVTATAGVDVTAKYAGTGAQIKLGGASGAYVHLNAFGTNPSISAGALTATGLSGSNNVQLRLYNAAGSTSAAGGAIKVSGAIKSSHGSVMFMGGKHAAVTDTGTINAGTVVTLQGKDISATGSITAAGSMAATATHSTGTSAATVTLGNVTAKKITIYDKGTTANVTAGALTANGLASTDNVKITLYNAGGTGGANAGTINLSGVTKSSHGSVVLSGPSISGGSIAASARAISLTAKNKVTLNSGTATAKKITITSPSITVNNLQAQASVVSFQGITLNATRVSGGAPANIIVNGNIKTIGSGDVVINQNGGSGGTGTNGGNISVTGSISAASGHGKVSITASDTRTGGSHGGNITLGSVVGGPINIFAKAKQGANITVVKLASHPSGGTGNISLTASDTSAAVNGGNIKITSTAPAVEAGNGSILLNAAGGGTSGGRVSVAGSIGSPLGNNNGVAITARNTGTATGTQVKLASVFGKYIHVNASGLKPTVSVGAMTAKGSPSGSLTADAAVILHPQTGSGSGSGQINVNGNLKSSHSGVTLNAGKGNVTVASTASITAGKNADFTAHRLTLGNVTAAGSLGVNIQDLSTASPGIVMASTAMLQGLNVTVLAIGSAAFAPTMQLGNVTATGSGVNGNIRIDSAVTNKAVNMTVGNLAGHRINLNNSDGSITAGTLTAPTVSVVDKNGNITLGAITASSALNAATVLVQASGGSAAPNAITVNGNITVQGKTPANPSFVGGFGMPEAATLTLNASGPAGQTHNVTVNGSVSVKALAGTFAVNQTLYARLPNGSGGSSTKSFHLVANGSGGVADAYIVAGNNSAGTAKVTGTVSITGPDAHLNVMGGQVSVGSLTVTGSGHTITRTVTPIASGSTGSYSSNNSAGLATVFVDAQKGTVGSVKTGAITVSGKGAGDVTLFGKTVTGGNITVNTAAATAKRTKNTIKMGCSASGSTGPCGAISSDLYRGFGDKTVGTGSLHGGRADIDVNGGYATSASVAANSISVGTLSATGVGGAAIRLNGNTVAVQSAAALATKGTLNGAGTIHKWKSGSITGTLKETFNETGGGAFVDLHGGQTGSLTVTGNLSAKGPRAGISLSGNTINVGGAATVSGSGASLTLDVVFTPSTGTAGAFHTHFTGPGDIVGFTAEGGMTAGGTVNVGGSISVTGSGMVGAEILGNAVSLHNVTLNNTKTATYTLLDTRNSPSTQSFTAGSAGLIVANAALPTSGSNLVYTPATITGNLSVTAPTNAYVGVDATVSGNATVTATAKNVIGNNVNPFRTRLNRISKIVNLHGGGSGSSITGALPTLNLSAGNISLTAGSNLVLGSNALTATTSLSLSGTAVSQTGLVSANSVTVTAGTGAVALTLMAPNIDIVSGGNVALNDSAETAATTLTMGTGTFGSVAATFGGAATLNSGLNASQLTLSAVGALNLGSNALTVTGATTLSGAGVSGTGLLTTTTLSVAGGTGAVSLVTRTPTLNVLSATSVTVNDSAETGAALLTLGAGPFGAVSASFGGAATLASNLTAASLNLSAAGTLALGANTVTLTGTATLAGAGISGTGMITATGLSITGGTGTVNLLTMTPQLTVVSGSSITLNNSAETLATSLAFGTGTLGAVNVAFGGAGTVTTGVNAASLTLAAPGALNLGSNALTLTGAANLTGAGVTGTGVLTTSALTVTGGSNAVSLVSKTPSLDVISATNVTLNDSAETGAATLTLGAGPFGTVSATFGGAATLTSNLSATSVILNAAGALGLGANSLTLSSNATLSGAGVTGTGTLTAGSLTLNGGAGTTSLITNVTNLTIGNGSNVTLDNTANTGATTVNFGTGTLGNVALTFSGNATLGNGFAGSGFAMVSNTGSLDLTGATLNLTQALQLTAKQNVVLGGVNISAPVMSVVAGGNIGDGATAGTIAVNGLVLTATGNILMPQTQFNLGSGTVSGVSGDAALLTDLAADGLAPGSSTPNAVLAAGGQLQIGGLNFGGSYLYLQGTSVSMLGPVTAAPGTLVQFAPLVPSDSIGIESAPATTATVNISNQQFMSLFPAATIAVGSGIETGNVTIGSNGPITLASNTNFVVLTSGTVTGLSNITSSGIVKSLLGTVVYTPTTGDIDPTASSTSSNTSDTSSSSDKKKKQSSQDTGTESTSDNGTVQQDTSTESVCRG